MVKNYRPETERWLASAAEKPFGHARCRSGLEVITAVFPDNRSQLAVMHVEDAGQLRIKVLNPTIREQPNVSLRATLQEHYVEWRQHSENGRTMLRTSLRAPGTPRKAPYNVERNVGIDFSVSHSGLETVLTDLQLDGKVDTIQEAQSEIHVDLRTPRVATARPNEVPRLFVCYARADRHWATRFVTMLKPAVDKGKLDVAIDLDITAGSDWHWHIVNALESCDAALLLVTPEFHVSEYITKVELQTLLDRRVRIFWVALKSSLVEWTELAGVQCVNDCKQPITLQDPKEHDKLIADACKTILGQLI